MFQSKTQFLQSVTSSSQQKLNQQQVNRGNEGGSSFDNHLGRAQTIRGRYLLRYPHQSSMPLKNSLARSAPKENQERFVMTLKDYFKRAGITKSPIASKAHQLTQASADENVLAGQSIPKMAKITNTKIKSAIEKAAVKYKLPKRFIESVIHAESNFNPKAVSHAGAMGLMQLMPQTAKELGVSNAYDIEQNVDGGSRYLRQMLDMFGQDKKIALAAYNAGPGAVKKYGGIPPYRETKGYVARIMKEYNAQT